MKKHPDFIYSDDGAKLLGISEKRMRDLWNQNKAAKDTTPGVRHQCDKYSFYVWMADYIKDKLEEVKNIHAKVRALRKRREQFRKDNKF